MEANEILYVYSLKEHFERNEYYYDSDYREVDSQYEDCDTYLGCTFTSESLKDCNGKVKCNIPFDSCDDCYDYEDYYEYYYGE